MIFTSISPNTERDDVLLALKMLFKPWAWKRGSYVQELEQAFKEKFDLANVCALQSGRNALYALLKALELHPGDEVLMQAYTCVAVPEPVLWAGMKPVYVDVLLDLTLDLEDLKKKITSKSKVLIIQHTFGVPARLDELLALAKQYNLFVIEDCAHAMGARYKNKYVGTFGDASFFSFGRDKVLSSIFGGMLVVKDTELMVKVKNIRHAFSYPSLISIKRQLLHPIIMSVAKSTYTFLSIGKIIIEVSKRIKLIPKAVESSELDGGKPSFFAQKMPNALAYLALHQFKKLDRYNAHRKEIAGQYEKLFSQQEIKNKYQVQAYESHADPIWLRYTIFTASPQNLIRYARGKHIELGDWYQNAIAPKRVAYEKIGYDPTTCPKAEKYAAQSVNLPTHIMMQEKSAEKIIAMIKEYAG